MWRGRRQKEREALSDLRWVQAYTWSGGILLFMCSDGQNAHEEGTMQLLTGSKLGRNDFCSSQLMLGNVVFQ